MCLAEFSAFIIAQDARAPAGSSAKCHTDIRRELDQSSAPFVRRYKHGENGRLGPPPSQAGKEQVRGFGMLPSPSNTVTLHGVATGISQYLIGIVFAPARCVLRLGGFEGDKGRGIADLTLAAERGHVRIVLAIVYTREKNPERAHQLLDGLRRDFPRNPLFAQEMARLDSGDRRGLGK